MDADREEAIRQMLAAKVYAGTRNCSYGMTPYVFKYSQSKGQHIFDLGKVWEKIKLAALMVYAVEEPRDVLAISSKPFGQRAVHKFSQAIGCLCIDQRFTPGYFTNHSIEGKFLEPRLIIVCDPNHDTQAVREASYANIPCIALCDSDASLAYVDCVIPCNTANKNGIGLVMWLLAREVLRLRGELRRGEPWSVLPDLFFSRSADDERKIDAELNDVKGEPTTPTESSAPAPAAAAPDESVAVDEWS